LFLARISRRSHYAIPRLLRRDRLSSDHSPVGLRVPYERGEEIEEFKEFKEFDLLRNPPEANSLPAVTG
jgi:hypothetical protein